MVYFVVYTVCKYGNVNKAYEIIRITLDRTIISTVIHFHFYLYSTLNISNFIVII